MSPVFPIYRNGAFMSKRINLNKPSDQLLMDLINYSQGTDLPMSVISFGTPQTLTAQDQAEYGRNTLLRIDPAPDSGYDEFVELKYNRIDLARLFRNQAVVGVDSEFHNSTEALALINAKYGLAISPSEIVAINAADFQVAIEITNSKVYVPGTRIVVGINVDESLLLDFEAAVDALWLFTNVTFPPIATTPLQA